jgi:hypothetical protein
MPETNTSQPELYFGINNPDKIEIEHMWYQDNLDIVFPVLIILVGLFQFILRKWVLPVSEDIISKLDDQFPSQGLIYNPAFGVFLMIAGIVLLAVFNLYTVFS